MTESIILGILATAFFGVGCFLLGREFGIREIEQRWSEQDSKAFSMLKNARNILRDGSYLYANDIDRFLDKLKP